MYKKMPKEIDENNSFLLYFIAVKVMSYFKSGSFASSVAWAAFFLTGSLCVGFNLHRISPLSIANNVKKDEIMAKKTKNRGKSSADKAEPSNGSDASNIFSKLFGEVPENDEVSNSLFSDNNPFRRKHIGTPQSEQNFGSASVETNQDTKAVDSENPSDSMPKKGKRKKDKSIDVDVDSNAFEGKKSGKDKKIKDQESNIDTNPKLGVKDEVRNANLEVEGVGREGSDTKLEKKKKKKRKRDELEREYETRVYGVAPEEEGEKKDGKKEGKLAGAKRKSVENPAEMVVSKEGYDDETKLLRTIFVGNLPMKVKKKALLKEFSRFGDVESVRIRSVPTLDNKKPKKVQVMNNELNEAVDSVHAYIVYKTEESAEASLAQNMAVVAGNHIRVDRACPPRKKLKGESAVLYDNKRTVFVGNLPFDVKDEELYKLFCGINQLEGSLEAVRVVRDPHTSLGKGIAYVLFKTKEAANMVCRKRNLKLRDRELRICHAKSNPTTPAKSNPTTPFKRKNPSSGQTENSPAKKFASAGARTPGSGFKAKAKPDTSYQGLRASKSGHDKNASSRTVPSKPTNQSGGVVKQRKEKRPSVAARKAKAKPFVAGEAPNHAGKKRKMDIRTPSSSHRKNRNKKLK